jgi:hypothetical protein
MISTFVPKTKQKNFKVFKSGFETAKFPDIKFDLVFSSPPFFDVEKYSTFTNNSLTKYAGEKAWCENFFIKSLIIAYNKLEKNGHLVLYMGGSPYVMRQMHRLDKVMKYIGVIYAGGGGIFVWEKVRDDVITVL